jgi:hypothetical protein
MSSVGPSCPAVRFGVPSGSLLSAGCTSQVRLLRVCSPGSPPRPEMRKAVTHKHKKPRATFSPPPPRCNRMIEGPT